MNRARNYRYKLVDVFTKVPFQGNQLAVFPDAVGLDDVTMQNIAAELKLTETTFVFPASLADCVADVRIFTPFKEMIFAGHPTIGTAYVLLDEGRIATSISDFKLQEKVGRVPVRVARENGDLIWLQTPAIRWGKNYDPALCAAVLGLNESDLQGCAPQWLSAGNPTLFIPLHSPDMVDRAWFGADGMRQLREADSEQEPFCVFVFAPTTDGAYSRMFAPEYGIAEDPATGSSTGPLAAYMMKHQLALARDGTRWVSEQGVKMSRRSRLHVQIRGPSGSVGIDVGGYVTPIGEGQMNIRAQA